MRRGFAYSYFTIATTLIILLLIVPTLIASNQPSSIDNNPTIDNVPETHFALVSGLIAYATQEAKSTSNESKIGCANGYFVLENNLVTNEFRENIILYAERIATSPEATDLIQLLAQDLLKYSSINAYARCVENKINLDGTIHVKEDLVVEYIVTPVEPTGPVRMYTASYLTIINYTIDINKPIYSIYDRRQEITINRTTAYTFYMNTGGAIQYPLLYRNYSVPISSASFTCTEPNGVTYDLKYDIITSNNTVIIRSLYNENCKYTININYIDGFKITLVYYKRG